MSTALSADADKADSDGVAWLVGPSVAGDNVWQRNCGSRGSLEKSATVRYHHVNQPTTGVVKTLTRPVIRRCNRDGCRNEDTGGCWPRLDSR